ncbi:hypothetical protein WOLCODRAFT_157095 [Wolfiporia cocos MD-104 SS10]|uniref:Transmembrane protein n=1 Tax=Wolfiporia cocos (strain MD-104) TaxID=742152 RepID=A0A2H3J2B1_WOLCO|nr:hypothetical protein WOLCODRAFT_157095 [Wolfiporia cocos MD-104 SS10]
MSTADSQSAADPSLLLSVWPALLKTLFSSILIFGALLLFTFLPQMAILVLVSGPLVPILAPILALLAPILILLAPTLALLAPILALLASILALLAPILTLLLISAETVLIFSFFAYPLLLAPALAHVFDATLRARGQGELVESGLTLTRNPGAEGALLEPFQALSGGGPLRYLARLSLNFVPLLGLAAFVLYNGYQSGPSWHARYFQLKGCSEAQQRAFVDERRAEYAAFGIVSLLFTLIPLVGPVFIFTNTVGAAMWAAQLEAQANLLQPPESDNEE